MSDGPEVEAQEIATQGTHTAVPNEVFQAIVNLIGNEISWGKADPLMTAIRQQAHSVNLAEKPPAKE